MERSRRVLSQGGVCQSVSHGESWTGPVLQDSMRAEREGTF